MSSFEFSPTPPEKLGASFVIDIELPNGRFVEVDNSNFALINYSGQKQFNHLLIGLGDEGIIRRFDGRLLEAVASDGLVRVVTHQIPDTEVVIAKIIDDSNRTKNEH